ncbi:MAG: CoA ester lyase [Caulobacterales bacterium]|nr:CoA ester lyase [Caulobacterales bacterium]
MTPAPRSVLFVPASNARALDKARTLDCDAVVIDLEDAVGPADKGAARAAALAALPQFDGRAAVRTNAPDTPWGEDDLNALRESRALAVVLPKTGSPQDVRWAARAGLPVWAMIETLAGVLNLAAIASESGVEALILGQNDLAAEMEAVPGPGRDPLHLAMSLIVTTARSHGQVALDGVFNAFRDDAGFAAECTQGRAFGFHGKTLIHPAQIAMANTTFGPSKAEIAWAQAIVQAYAVPGAEEAGVLSVDGRMVERLHLDQARRILGRA